MGTLGAAKDSNRDGWGDLKLEYHTVQPNRWTFQSRTIREWIEQRLRGRVLNACAGKTRLAHDHEIVRNDIDEQRDADLHLDVCEIADELEDKTFDTVVYDPPFSSYQASRSYEGRAVGDTALAKRQFHELLAPGGRVIQFGYTTTCMPMALDYERVSVGVFNTLGQMNDILGAVDQKPGRRAGRTEVVLVTHRTRTCDEHGPRRDDDLPDCPGCAATVRLAETEQRLTAVEAALDELEQRLEAVEAEFDELEADG